MPSPVPQRQPGPSQPETEYTPTALVPFVENQTPGSVDSTCTALSLAQCSEVSTKPEVVDTSTSFQGPEESLFSKSSTTNVALMPFVEHPPLHLTGFAPQQQPSRNMISVFTGMAQELEVKEDQIRVLVSCPIYFFYLLSIVAERPVATLNPFPIQIYVFRGHRPRISKTQKMFWIEPSKRTRRS